MKNNIYHLLIELNHSEPKIWRRVLVPANIPLTDLHKIIQTTMGWTNTHLHQFIKNNTIYSTGQEEEDIWGDIESVDYKENNILLNDLLNIEKDNITYEYDFGDGWEHDIILEKILPVDEKTKYPVCLAGKMNCPPEDCGGVFGYSDLLKILKNPAHEEYESYMEWLDGEFDPELFDIDEVNDLLQQKDYGCIEF